MSLGFPPTGDVVGVGNAMVDVLAHADDSFLSAHGLARGAMTLIDAEQGTSILAAMGQTIEVSGGSVANTMAGIASLGGACAYVGRVHDDRLGAVFSRDMRSLGIAYDTPPASDGAPTARCLVIVTPDGQRTMATYLGACTELAPEDLNLEAIDSYAYTYLEGYLWDAPRGPEALRLAAQTAKDAARRVAFTLSDPFCVERHREEFREFVLRFVDVLFANQDEVTSLYAAADVWDALAQARRECRVAAITRSEHGSIVAAYDDTYEVAAAPVARVVDTTGAGDLYAAGFLYGITHGYDLPSSGRIGSIAAAEVIGHLGARPSANLRELVAAAL